LAKNLKERIFCLAGRGEGEAPAEPEVRRIRSFGLAGISPCFKEAEPLEQCVPRQSLGTRGNQGKNQENEEILEWHLLFNEPRGYYRRKRHFGGVFETFSVGVRSFSNKLSIL
jgi:hypothetical protein